MHPTLFKIGNLEVRSWGTMLIVAFAAGAFWMWREVRRQGMDPLLVVDFVLWMLIGSVVGARVVHVILDWGAYRHDPLDVLKVWTGGLSFHGGLAGAIVAAIIFARVRRMPTLELFDLATPSIPLGYAFARIGCFLSGCCRGIPASPSWPLKFRFVVDPHTPDILTVPSHPAQLYSSAASLVVFALLLWMRPRLHRPGQLFFAYVVLYSFQRFCLEFVRASETEIILGHFPLTLAQIAGIVFAVGGAAVVVMMERARLAESRKAAAAEPASSAKPEPAQAAPRKRRVHR
jgi:phosphatidylglycerol:prolipoprotein diacylglycerol transferase